MEGAVEQWNNDDFIVKKKDEGYRFFL